MRLSVECAFPHLRKRGVPSRKSAFWPDRLTEKRTLQPTPHGKAHSAIPRSRRMHFSVTSRRPGGVGQPPARLRGTMENGSTGQMRSSNPPPGCGAGCAGARKSRFGVWPHGKAHSARPAGSRMRLSVTSRRPGGVGQPPARLWGTMENASTGQMRSSNPPPGCGVGCARVRRSRFGVWPHGKAHSAQPVGSRMRFSVTTRPQNALFREGAGAECAFP